MAELKIISMDEVQSKEVNWLWYPYIPYGKITIIQGDPGEGKTTLALRLAALLSKGEALPYDDIEDALSFIKNREHPLALYLFSSDKALQRRVLQSVPFGGGCINDTIIHLATSRMGFGGVGGSGMGSYHGKKSFDTFSHQKSIVKKSTLIDLPIRYAPYSPLKDKLLRIFLR